MSSAFESYFWSRRATVCIFTLRNVHKVLRRHFQTLKIFARNATPIGLLLGFAEFLNTLLARLTISRDFWMSLAHSMRKRVACSIILHAPVIGSAENTRADRDRRPIAAHSNCRRAVCFCNSARACCTRETVPAQRPDRWERQRLAGGHPDRARPRTA